MTTEELFGYIYRKDAGIDRKTGKESLTLWQFEERYLGVHKESVSIRMTLKCSQFPPKIPVKIMNGTLTSRFKYRNNGHG